MSDERWQDEWEVVGPVLAVERNGCYYCPNCGDVSNSQGSGHFDHKANKWECAPPSPVKDGEG